MTIRPDLRQRPIQPSAVRRCVADLEAYSPPADPAALAERLGRPVESIVKLDANENPFGPSPLVQERLSQYSTYHVYPDAAQREGRTALADYAGVPAEHLMLGNGADELIDLLMRAYIEPGDEVLDFPPSFGMYAFNARLCDARVVEVPRDDAFAIDVDAALAAITPRTKLILLTSPNNPTGTVMPTADVRRLLGAGPLVVLDEAYAEFAQVDGQGYESMIREVLTYPNLVVLRTFSKWAGLAGLRIGYAALPSGVAEHLWKIKPPFNANVAAIAAMIESLREREHLMGTVRKIVAERDRLLRELPGTRILRPHPTRANFILCNVIGMDARELHDRLADRGILVRHYGTPLLRDKLRISVGRPDQNDILLATLRDIATEGTNTLE
ncbi:MAG: histidinol-phosphate transaminase [Chloroflexota bacterium]|nr:histidinol-phosphate transaminase [Chloroflexota bacterium]